MLIKLFCWVVLLVVGKKSEFSVSIEGDSELAKAVNQTTEQTESQSSPQEADDSDVDDGEGNKKRVSSSFIFCMRYSN